LVLPPKSDPVIVMGRVVAPFGIKGWVKVRPFTDSLDGLLGYPDWFLSIGADWKSFKVLDAAVHGAAVIAQLAGIEDRDAANALRGRDVGVPRSAMPETEAGEYYWGDLIGLEVLNLEGERLGKVERLLETGANPVMILSGDRERLLPFVAAVVQEVSLDRREILVDWGSDY
jgi:16S rRNA processing protein RimM